MLVCRLGLKRSKSRLLEFAMQRSEEKPEEKAEKKTEEKSYVRLGGEK